MLSVHRAYIIHYPFRSLTLTKRAAVRVALVLWALSLALHIAGLAGSPSTLFDYKFLSCNAGIYLVPVFHWSLCLIGPAVGISGVVLVACLVYILRFMVTLKARDRALGRDPTRGRSVESRKGVISVVGVGLVFVISIAPGIAVHVFKYLPNPSQSRTISRDILYC